MANLRRDHFSDRLLAKAIAEGISLEAVSKEAKTVEEELCLLRKKRAKVNQDHDSVGEFDSPAKMAVELEKVLGWLAKTSRDFAEILRRLVPSFVIVPVQALDRPQVRPRAKLEISTAAWSKPGEASSTICETIDLFDPPIHIEFLQPCVVVKRVNPKASLSQISSKLGIGHMSVKLALDYHLLMQKEGLAEPYRELTECPENASRWGKRAS